MASWVSGKTQREAPVIDVESRLEEEMPFPADRLWGLVADFGALGDWWPPGLVDHVDVDGEGVGMVRHIHTVVGIVLSERLDALDHDQVVDEDAIDKVFASLD